MSVFGKSILGRYLQVDEGNGDLLQDGKPFIRGALNSGNKIANVTASTLTVTRDLHDGKLITLNRAAGITCTLPAATGSGAIYRFHVGTTVTSNNNIIKVANSTDVMQGIALTAVVTTTFSYATAATSDTITFNGTSTGGVVGTYVEVEDSASGIWAVRVFLVGTAVASATPFSATV